jgi:hypothetical protein
LRIVSRTEGVGFEGCSEFGESTENEGIVEVDILDTFGMASKALDKTVKVWTLSSG